MYKINSAVSLDLLDIFWCEMWFILMTPLLILMASQSNVS